MGAQAWVRTSQTRNRSTPMADAFSSARSVGTGLRSRPIGSPRRMVTPAMKPSNMVDIKLTSYLGFTDQTGRNPHTAKVRIPLVAVKSGERGVTGACSAFTQRVHVKLPSKGTGEMV